ncbi:VOC family protein [Nonomuraea insulae]|uniref:VOC family protein n=1 Tax=Nonomuraea insulae TaxID=1616787 RepID=A0ABW1D8E1_9ACTN
MLYAIGEETPGLLVRVHDTRPGSMRVWLEVPDARAVAAESGIEPFEVFTGWTVEVPDPWGNVIGLTDYGKQPSLSRRY